MQEARVPKHFVRRLAPTLRMPVAKRRRGGKTAAVEPDTRDTRSDAVADRKRTAAEVPASKLPGKITDFGSVPLSRPLAPPLLFELAEERADDLCRLVLVSHEGRPVSSVDALSESEWRGFATQAVLAREACFAAIQGVHQGEARSEDTIKGNQRAAARDVSETASDAEAEPSPETAIQTSVSIAVSEMDEMITLLDAVIGGFLQTCAAERSGSTRVEGGASPAAPPPILRPVPRDHLTSLKTPETLHLHSKDMDTERDTAIVSVQRGSSDSMGWAPLWMRRVQTLQSIAAFLRHQQEVLVGQGTKNRRFREDLAMLCYGDTTSCSVNRLRPVLLDTRLLSDTRTTTTTAAAAMSPKAGMQRIRIEAHLHDDCWIPLWPCERHESALHGHISVHASDIASRLDCTCPVLLQCFRGPESSTWYPDQEPLLPLQNPDPMSFRSVPSAMNANSEFVGVAAVRRLLFRVRYQQTMRRLYERLIHQAHDWLRMSLQRRYPGSPFARYDGVCDLRDVDERGFTFYDALSEQALLRVAFEQKTPGVLRSETHSASVPPLLQVVDDIVGQHGADFPVLWQLLGNALRICHGTLAVYTASQTLGLLVASRRDGSLHPHDAAASRADVAHFTLEVRWPQTAGDAASVCRLHFGSDAVSGWASTDAASHPEKLSDPSQFIAFLIRSVESTLLRRAIDAWHRALRTQALEYEVALLASGVARVKVWPSGAAASSDVVEPQRITMHVEALQSPSALPKWTGHVQFRLCLNSEECFVGDAGALWTYLDESLNIQRLLPNL